MKRPFLLGLTGSIGMGKSTTARMFEEAGIPVWDADAAVHRLYNADGAAYGPVAALCPAAARADGIDRAILREEIARDPGLLQRLESVVHPLVARDRAAFIDSAHARGEPLVVLDIPLLFETGAEKYLDATLVVTAPPEVQRARVMARADMTEERLDSLLARQMPDAEKRDRATYVIETRSLAQTRSEIDALIAELRSRIDA